jgi:type IX secretion system PorP/SprF family membrane protein
MNFRQKLKTITLVALTACTVIDTQAQDIHFTQFNGSPLTLNPALTGGFNGLLRVNGIYRNQWSSVTSPYVTFGASVDMPLFKEIAKDDYLAAGLQIYNDRSGDGNLVNLSTLASLAYHKALDADARKVLTVGIQGGYTQKSIDLARLYWSDEFFNSGFQPGTTIEQINPKVKYFTANAGLDWQHVTGESGKFSYQLGIGAHNLNQPRESFLKKANNQVGLGIRLSSYFGANWWITERLGMRPAFMMQTQTKASEMVAGSEFMYVLGEPDIKSNATSVFVGTWMRFGDAMMYTAGFETKGFRVGFAYDNNTSNLKSASNGQGGFELMFRYIQPNPLDFARRVLAPCARF